MREDIIDLWSANYICEKYNYDRLRINKVRHFFSKTDNSNRWLGCILT